jgi:thiosulfate dehydrogenase
MKRWFVGLVSFVLGLIIVPLALMAYLEYGRPPVAVGDSPSPMEAAIVRKILHNRIDSEMQNAPFQSSPQVLTAGAAIYKDHCAFCHGLPDRPADVGSQMFPSAPQLWKRHKDGVVGVSDDPVGETFWRVKNGIRLTGMPSYKELLSEQEMWQVSLLLASADKPLPASAQQELQPK